MVVWMTFQSVYRNVIRDPRKCDVLSTENQTCSILPVLSLLRFGMEFATKEYIKSFKYFKNRILNVIFIIYSYLFAFLNGPLE